MIQQANKFTAEFAPFAERMKRTGSPDIVIRTFAHYYQQLCQGETGLIPEADIVPVETLPNAETFSNDLAAIGQAVLSKTVILKLNGGLGTSMGLNRAKSLLVVKDGLSFLEVTARQALQASVPLVLMNSFVTQNDSLTVLSRYPKLRRDIPLDFLQHKVPKVAQADLSPVKWPKDPDLEWCPPGHGDIYTALVTSGMLNTLLEAGYEYVFVSNVDNLGGVIEPAILGYFAQNNIPFMMEVADRTKIDKKGGHLAQLPNGQLILRESAQCPPDELDDFQDITRHKYFNTNNLWLNLPALKATLTARDNILGLPLIRNAKTVDPRDSNSMPVYQLETAMGSAISIFPDAQAIRVPRTRFAPVKTTNDLLLVRSDAYILTNDFQVNPNPKRQLGQLLINLDPTYYKLVTDLEARFPYGAPSLLDCERLTVRGDFKFGKNITMEGTLWLVNQTEKQIELEDGAVIKGEYLQTSAR